MRILIIGFTYIVDVYQTKLDAIENLEATHIGLISPAKWNFPQWKSPFILDTENKTFEVFPANVWFFNGRNGAFLYPWKTLYKSIKSFQPDVIYLEQEVFSLSSFQVALLAKWMRIPLAIFCWENMDKRLYFRRLLANFVMSSAKLITPGNEGAAALLKKWGYKGPLQVMPQVGVDTVLFSPKKRKKHTNKFAIGYVGRFVYEKGIDLILEAGKNLIDAGIDIEIVLCGDGPYATALREKANQLEISETIRWLGEFKYAEVPSAIAQMDVLVLPSRTNPGVWMEQFGHVLIEAMAMKVPVIGSSSGAIPEVIGNPNLIFSEGNTQALSEILVKLGKDLDWYTEMADFGYQRVQDLYSNEAVAYRLRNYLEEIS